MIYVFGMSHAINVLKAIKADPPLHSPDDNWDTLAEAGHFFDFPAKPGLIPGDILKAFIVPALNSWGTLAEMHVTPDGKRKLVGVKNFVNILLPLEDVQDDSVLFSFIHGNEHSVLSMAQHPVPYDFYLPEREDQELVPGAQPVPYEIIRRQMHTALSDTIAALGMIRFRLPRMRLVHVLPPPPVASEAQILQSPERFREELMRWGITPISIRVKYYLLAADILRNALAPFNVEILEAPPQAIGTNGAIKDEYAFGATHANQSYGELVCKQMHASINDKG